MFEMEVTDTLGRPEPYNRHIGEEALSSGEVAVVDAAAV